MSNGHQSTTYTPGLNVLFSAEYLHGESSSPSATVRPAKRMYQVDRMVLTPLAETSKPEVPGVRTVSVVPGKFTLDLDVAKKKYFRGLKGHCKYTSIVVDGVEYEQYDKAVHDELPDPGPGSFPRYIEVDGLLFFRSDLKSGSTPSVVRKGNSLYVRKTESNVPDWVDQRDFDPDEALTEKIGGEDYSRVDKWYADRGP